MIFLIVSTYQSGMTTWVRSSFWEAINLAFTLMSQEIEGYNEITGPDAENLEIYTAIESLEFSRALKMYTEMTSSPQFENQILIAFGDLGGEQMEFIDPEHIDKMIDKMIDQAVEITNSIKR